MSDRMRQVGWNEGEKKKVKVVFIGRNLDKEVLFSVFSLER